MLDIIMMGSLILGFGLVLAFISFCGKQIDKK